MATEQASPQSPRRLRATTRTYPWSAEYGGTQHQGTVVVAQRWAPELGKALESEEERFRIILLTQPQEVPQEGLEDPRILCWVPTTQTSYRVDPAARPPRALRERGARFGAVSPSQPGTRSAENQMALFGSASPDSEGTGASALPMLPDVRAPARLFSRVTLPLDPRTLAAASTPDEALGLLAVAILTAVAAPGPPLALLPWIRALWGADSGEIETLLGRELFERLSLRLKEIREGLQQIEKEVPLLLAQLDGSLELAHQAVLERLTSLAGGTNVQEFVAEVQERYTLVDELAQDIQVYERFRVLCAVGSDIREAKGYLDAAPLPEGEPYLDTERTVLLTRLNLSLLLSQPHLWPGIEAHMQQFKASYHVRYRGYHRAYQERLALLRANMGKWDSQLRALERLNTLVELGEPLAADLPQRQATLLDRLAPCPAGPEGKDTATLPVCSACGFSPLLAPPDEEVQKWTVALETVLDEQLRRLSTEVIRGVIASRNEPEVDQFLKVVQASDLSTLVGVLDEKMVAFLRGVIAEARTLWLAFPVADRLKEHFPWVEEGQEQAVAETFAALLRKAFQEAKAAHPQLRIRLRLQ